MFTDASVADHRQGRASSHAELLSSKAKREQTLRSILTARRRQILSQRSHEPSRTFLNRTPRPNTTSKDPPDIFETQETKHNIYVTSAQTEASVDEETPQSSKKSSEKKATSAINLDSMELEVEQQTPKMLKDETPSMSTTEKYESASSTSSSTVISTTPTNQKSGDADTRKKNIVSMPESLYNHFRPVESNIPMEDMSQFLYFGQKLQPDAQNVTSNNNNSGETTSSVPISSRRRYSSKRFSATIAAPIEEIMNDEMNIALERRTVEKNQVSRIKNTFRSPGSGLYYRKTRPTSDVASNVISGNESNSSSIISGSDTRSEMNTVDGKLRRGDPSVHAGARISRERGNGATHVVKANTTTQIPRQRHDDAEAGVAESEINVKFSNDTIATANGIIAVNLEKMSNDFAKDDNEKKVVETQTETRSAEKSEDKLTNVVEKVISTPAKTNSRSRDVNNIETSSPRAESSTLRIVVPDDNFRLSSFAIESERTQRNTVKQQPVPSDRPVRVSVNDNIAPKLSPSSTTESSAPVVVVDSSQQQPQQQHVYAYTITNVTRLLRNYTGPRLNGEERRGGGEVEGGGAAGRPAGSGAEITSDGPSQQQQPPPPLPLPPSSPLLLPRVGSASIEPARTPAGLSTGATVEPAAAAGLSPSVVVGSLVGERPRKVVPQQQQRASNQRAIWSLPHPAGNDSVISTTRPVKSPENRGLIRWNQIKSRINEQEGANDRRFLRKSASAVLNQRSTINEESSSLVTSKRRRVLASQSGLSSASNDSKKANSNNREKIESATEELTVNDRSLNETITSRGNDSEDEVLDSPRKIVRVSGGVNKVPADENSPETTIMGNLGRNSSATDETMNTTDPSVLVDAIAMTEANKPDVPAGDVVSASSVNDEDSIGSEDYQNVVMSNKSSDSDANVTTDNVVTTTMIVTERVGETVAKTTTTTTTTSTTPAAPVFPVTPRILTEEERTTMDLKTFIDAGTKAPEASNLDPSEIQKRYRAKDATTSTTTTTTMISPIQNDTRPVNDVPSKKSEVLSTSSTPADNGKRISGERSPEVRARNLSDKSKDKDDVLPIMHLYNTSDIFNGSRSVDGFVRGTERTRVMFSVDPKSQNEKSPEKTTMTTTTTTTMTTTEKTSQSTTIATSTTEISGSTSTTIPVPKPKEASTTASTTNFRKDKHEQNRGSQNTTVPPVMSRGSSFTPAVNRTRYRPTYHPSILPEYNGTIYHPAELNRTFFEVGGPISVSSQEPMNISDVISKRHDGNATQETVAVVSYILATLVVFPIAVGVGLILRRLILRNRKVSDFGV